MRWKFESNRNVKVIRYPVYFGSYSKICCRNQYLSLNVHSPMINHIDWPIAFQIHRFTTYTDVFALDGWRHCNKSERRIEAANVMREYDIVFRCTRKTLQSHEIERVHTWVLISFMEDSHHAHISKSIAFQKLLETFNLCVCGWWWMWAQNLLMNFTVLGRFRHNSVYT